MGLFGLYTPSFYKFYNGLACGLSAAPCTRVSSFREIFLQSSSALTIDWMIRDANGHHLLSSNNH
jgi:hypothetical protein